ncbi:MAG: oligosaccharide flippase family protein [Candidatus Micrarchaeota archaeon]|nr:oligosaccharide flippase family protein [Candidatus Micrarchaeota archaeon]
MEEPIPEIGSRAAKMFYSLSAGRLVNVFITLVLFIYVANKLTAADFGIYTFAFGFGSLIVAAFSAFGVSHYFNKFLTDHVDRKDFEQMLRTLSNGYTLVTAVAVLLLLLGFALSQYAATYMLKQPYASAAIMLASVATFFFVIKTTSETALVGFGRGDLSAIALMVTAIAQLAASVVLIQMGHGVMGAVYGMLIGYAIGFLMGIYYVLKSVSVYGKFRLVMPTREEMRKTLSFSAPIGFNNLLNTGANNFSILYIGAYVTNSMLGSYGIAVKGLAFMIVFYSAMSMTMIQAFTSARSSSKDGKVHSLYNRIINYSLLLTLPIFVFVGVFAKPELFLVLTSKYAYAPIFLTLIAFGVAINSIGLYLSGLLIANERTGKILKYAFVSMIFQIAFLLALVPNGGFLGAAGPVLGGIIAIFIIGSIVDDAMFIIGVKRVLGLSLEYRKLIGIFASNAMLALILYICLNLVSGYVAELAAGVAVTLLAYPILATKLGTMDMSDIEALRRATGKIRLLSWPVGMFLDYSSIFASRK